MVCPLLFLGKIVMRSMNTMTDKVKVFGLIHPIRIAFYQIMVWMRITFGHSARHCTIKTA